MTASADSCRISYHSHQICNVQYTSDTDHTLFLKQIQDIVVMPEEQWVKRLNSELGHPEWNFQTDPPVFTLVVKSGDQTASTISSDGKRGEFLFTFYDETLSHRVANALQHAVELCGGGSQEPF